MTPRPDVSKLRTAQITQAAIEVITKNGLEGTTMDAIAARADINKATIYLYFDSKDALIQAIAEQLFTQELADLYAACELAGTATDRLYTYYETLISEESDVFPLLPVIYEYYSLGLRSENVNAVLVHFMDETASLLQSIIQDGISTGEFAAVDAQDTARVFIALLDGLMIQWAYYNDLNIGSLLRFSIKLLFQGLTNHK
jgi:AcrR family transcriptional regulator